MNWDVPRIDYLCGISEQADDDRDSYHRFQDEFDADTCRALIGMISDRDRRIDELEATIKTLRRLDSQDD